MRWKELPRAKAASKPAFRGVHRGGEANDLFALQLASLKLPKPEREWVFGRPRLFRFDFAWPVRLIAVEINGGIWARGGAGHSHPKGILRDYEKLNLAASLGWRVWQFTTDEVRSGAASLAIAKALHDNPISQAARG